MSGAPGCGREPCAADDPGVRPLARAVDAWPVADGGAPVLVWQLDVATLGLPGERGAWDFFSAFAESGAAEAGPGNEA
eukprot:gene25354-63240_t